MKTKIVWKLTAAFGVVLLFFTLVLGLVFLIMFRQHTLDVSKADMEKRAYSIAETLAGFEGRNLGEMGGRSGNGKGNGKGNGMGHEGTGHEGRGHEGEGRNNPYLRFLNELSMAQVWIVDAKGELITMQHCDMPCSELPKSAGDIVGRVLQGETTYGEEFSGFLDTPTVTVGVPILQDGVIKGAVLLHSPASGTELAVRQGLSILFMGIVIALLFAILAAYALSLQFTKPLRKMKKAALMLADGEYEARTQVTQKDEIGQLAETIDFLAERLAVAEEERSRLDQLKQEFIANISHELRTPVAVLRGSLEVLRDGTIHEGEEIRGYYDQMLSESRHLERLVGDMLDLSRLQDTQFKLNLSEVNLCDVIRDSARSIRPVAAEKGIEIKTQIPEEVCLITGDYGRIRQLLLILLDNAVKYSDDGESASLTLHDRAKEYTFVVANKGAAISPEEIPHLFERFYRAKREDHVGGTGLGLAIAWQIAVRHGVQIQVDSNQERTEFQVSFPKELTAR